MSFFFWLQDLSSQPGTEPRTMAVKAPSPNHWTTGNSQGRDHIFSARSQIWKHCIHSQRDTWSLSPAHLCPDPGPTLPFL